MTSRLVRHAVATCLLFLAVCSSASAETVFFDNFNDGSVTNGVPLDRHGNPVVWTPVPGVDQGTGNASTGDYVLTTTGAPGAFVSAASPPPISDTSVRAQIQLLDGFAAIGLLARFNAALGNAYQAGISTRSNPGNAYITRNDDFGASNLVLQPAPVDVNAGNVNIQFDVIGDTLSLFVWNVGDPKPADPFIETTDSLYSSGTTGVLLDSTGGPATSVFRFVHVADAPIPEPSTAMLCAFGMIGLVALRRRRIGLSRC